jgi:L-threonine-O-3-phosphate decarboxylase
MTEGKREIDHLPPVYHGAFDYDELARLGLSPEDVIDFSVNSNPYGPPPGVREALARVPLERYPDRECLALRGILAQKHGVTPEHLVVGNGTTELLQLIALAFIRPGDTALVVEPTFGEYQRVSLLAGGRVTTLTLARENGFQPDAAAIAKAIGQSHPRIVWLCHPNNPTGISWDVQRIGGLIDTFRNSLFVIDEAYLRFDPGAMSVHEQTDGYPNVLISRSMTKDYALAGLRLGYLIGQPDQIEAVRRVRPAWNVNALAQAAGAAALEQDTWLADCIGRLHENKRALTDGLRRLGFDPLPSSTHYFLVRVGDGAAFRARLLRHNVMVRDCASFGLPEFVRIATRTPAENSRLLDALAAPPA